MLEFNGAGATAIDTTLAGSTAALWNVSQRVGWVVKQPRARLGAFLTAEKISNRPADSAFDIRERPERALPGVQIIEARLLLVDIPGCTRHRLAIRQRRDENPLVGF